MRVENITKIYGEKTVLDQCTYDFNEGEITVVMGPSGCGKTTLLRIIAGLEKADLGELYDVPKKLSMVFQEDRLCETSTALANVLIASSNKEKDKAINMLEELGLGKDVDSYVSELSGGMRRRIAIARALMSEAKLILMDEPFTGLDVDNKQAVMSYVKKYLNGRTAIIVTHDSSEAGVLADNIINL